MHLTKIWLLAKFPDMEQVLIIRPGVGVTFYAIVGDETNGRSWLLAEAVCAARIHANYAGEG